MIKKNDARVFLSIAVFFVTTVTCHAETVLERALKVNDPELGACIQFALERRRERYAESEDPELELIRNVTELYIEIKLQDTQIQHLQRQLEQPDGPDALRRELILAQAELESKRETAFAKLRQVLYIIPRHHLGTIPTEQLKSHVTVDVVDSNQVWVYEGRIIDRRLDFTSVEKISVETVQECVQRILALAKQTPARITVRSYSPHSKTASALHRQLRDTIDQKRLGLDVELRLTIDPKERGQSTLSIVEGKIVSGRRSAGSGYRVTSSWDPGDSNRLDVELQGYLDPSKGPGCQPTTLYIEYCEASKEVAEMVAERARAILKKAGMESRSTVELELTKARWIK